jgi:long-chain acyl-CoA synthetase
MPSPSRPVSVELLTAADAERRQRRAAAALLAQGLAAGDRVAFALGSSADLVCAVLGAERVGIVPVLLNATLTPDERDHLADDARPALRIFDATALARLTGDDDTPATNKPVDLAPYPLTRSMHYTSGTTGRPKGVAVGLWDEATARAVYEDEAEVWHFDPKDVHLVCSPQYHTPSIRFSINTLLAGGALVILSRFDAATALDTLRRHRPTTAFLVPTHLQRMLQLPILGPDERFDSLRLLAHAGAPCPEAVKRAVMARANPGAVWEFYGSTEAQFTVCPPALWLEHPGTVGRARRCPPTPTRAAPSGASRQPSHASSTGTTRRRRGRPGAATPAPWVTSARSIGTATSS